MKKLFGLNIFMADPPDQPPPPPPKDDDKCSDADAGSGGSNCDPGT